MDFDSVFDLDGDGTIDFDEMIEALEETEREDQEIFRSAVFSWDEEPVFALPGESNEDDEEFEDDEEDDDNSSGIGVYEVNLYRAVELAAHPYEVHISEANEDGKNDDMEDGENEKGEEGDGFSDDW